MGAQRTVTAQTDEPPSSAQLEATAAGVALAARIGENAADVAEQIKDQRLMNEVREQSLFVLSVTLEDSAYEWFRSDNDGVFLDEALSEGFGITEGHGLLASEDNGPYEAEISGTPPVLEDGPETTIAVGELTVAGAGTIDADSLERHLRRIERDIQRCYENRLATSPDLAGRIVLSVTIDETGRVDGTDLVENEVGDDVGSCVTSRVRRYRFDEPEGGSVTIEWTFVLDVIE